MIAHVIVFFFHSNIVATSSNDECHVQLSAIICLCIPNVSPVPVQSVRCHNMSSDVLMCHCVEAYGLEDARSSNEATGWVKCQIDVPMP